MGAQSEPGFVQIWVQDMGPGVLPEDRERIFDKFTRLKDKKNSRGFGLGLAYCRLAVLAHGGRIWVDSEAGSGANLMFSLPIAVDALSD